MVILPFIVLFGISVIIVMRVMSGRRKRRHAKEHKRLEEQTQAERQKEEVQCEKEEEAGERAKREELEQPQREWLKEEEQRRKTEEEHEYAKEKLQQEVEETRRAGQRSPLERGGRARSSVEDLRREQIGEIKSHFLKPEIICWKEGWKWIVGIEVPEELESPVVAQNGQLLEHSNIDELRYYLRYAEGTVKVTWNGEEKNIQLAGPGRNYLIFKMRKNWKEPGRLVQCSTTGYYLIIVPQDWKRDEEVSDHAPIAPENVHVEGYKVHFFYQEQNRNTVICFITPNGERVQVGSGYPRFQLIGREIHDASEYMGPLFGEQPPCIQTRDKKEWSNVGVIVVGQEGSGRNRWRMQFAPQVNTEEQKLPEEIANRRGGWYFVRIYDSDDNLLESMDFRFIIGLKDISMGSINCLPSPNGYDNVTVQFVHQIDCKVEFIKEDIQHTPEICLESGRTIVTVPPKPDCDKTRWILRDGDVKIEVTILVERIWWAFGTMRKVPDRWLNKPIVLSRKDFIAITDKALWVKFPRLHFVRKIDVGFNRTKGRTYQVEVEKKEITISLRDFCDAKEIENRQEESKIMMWVQLGGAKTDEAIIAKVLAERPNFLEKKPQKLRETLMGRKGLLRPIVKCCHGGRKRKGRGFSRKEITEAEIAMENMKLLHIAHDKRRRTSHPWNIETLKNLMRGDKHVNIK